MILAKLCVLGEVSVGKTSLIRRFVDRSFSDAYLTTVGVKISRKLVHVDLPSGGPAVQVQLVIWDLEGGHTSIDVSPTYLKGARGAIVVGDLTRPSTLDEIQSHCNRFLLVNPKGHIVVALNKADLKPDPEGTLANRWNTTAAVAKTFCTSAKTGAGVDEIFATLGGTIVRDSAHAANL